MLLSANLQFYYSSFDLALNSPMSAKRRHRIILVMKRERVISSRGTSHLYTVFPEREVYSLLVLLFKQVPNSHPRLGQGTMSEDKGALLRLLPSSRVTVHRVTSGKFH